VVHPDARRNRADGPGRRRPYGRISGRRLPPIPSVAAIGALGLAVPPGRWGPIETAAVSEPFAGPPLDSRPSEPCSGRRSRTTRPPACPLSCGARARRRRATGSCPGPAHRFRSAADGRASARAARGRSPARVGVVRARGRGVDHGRGRPLRPRPSAARPAPAPGRPRAGGPGPRAPVPAGPARAGLAGSSGTCSRRSSVPSTPPSSCWSRARRACARRPRPSSMPRAPSNRRPA